MSVFPYYRDTEAVKAAARGQLLSYVETVLQLRAEHIRELEESLIRIGHSTRWHEENAPSHDAMCAAALAFTRVIARGKDQIQRGVKVDPLIEDIVAAVRSSLIADIMAREGPVSKEEPTSSGGEGAASAAA